MMSVYHAQMRSNGLKLRQRTMLNIFAGTKREHPPDPHHIRIYTDPLKPYRSWIAAFLFFAIFSFAYGTLSPSFFRQPWESLMYAYWAELNGIRSIQGN